MDRNYRSDENWVINMYQKIEATFQDIDDFVYKEPVLFIGNQVLTVMQDLILSLKCIDLAEASTSLVAAVKETTVRQNISKPKEALVVPKMRYQPLISALQQLILLVKVNVVRSINKYKGDLKLRGRLESVSFMEGRFEDVQDVQVLK
ncbi:hypothetical protein Tco_1415305 [Tanacetum coccineum]